MSEVRIFYLDGTKIKIAKSLDILKKIDKQDIIWIDLINVELEVESELEQYMKIYIQEDEEMEEIEMSSRYIQTDDSLVANTDFLLENFEKETVSFIVKNNILVSVRDVELRSFNDTVKKMFVNARNYPSGFHVLVSLLETRVENDADMIEDTTDLITKLSNEINADSDQIGRAQRPSR